MYQRQIDKHLIVRVAAHQPTATPFWWLGDGMRQGVELAQDIRCREL